MVKEDKSSELAKALREYVEAFNRHNELMDRYMGKNLEKTWVVTEESLREFTEAEAEVKGKRERWLKLLRDARG